MNMKKSLIYILALSVIVGCQKSEVSEQIPAEGESSAVIVGSFPETKTSFVDEGNVMKTEWVKGDALGVYWYKGGAIEGVGTGVADKQLNDKITAKESGSTTIFKIDNYYLAQAWVKYLTYAYYPYNASAGKDPFAVKFVVPSSVVQTSAGDASHLNATDLLYSSVMAEWDYKNDETKNVKMTFSHALSVLNIALTSAQSNYSVSDIRVRFEDESEIFSVTEGSVNLSDGSLTLTSGTPEISLHFNEAAKLSATPVNAYMTITPGHAGKTFSVYATVNGIETKLGSKKVPASGLPAGVKAALSFEVNEIKAEYTDLSTAGVANCYLISAPGNYKFKATVKGNGVIPEMLSSAVPSAEMTPKSALVLWYNTKYDGKKPWNDASPVYVNSVSLDNGYICFSTPKEFVPGNVVIAAFAEEGVTYDNITVDEKRNITSATLLWSWNIWAAEGYDFEADAITVGGYKMMNRNLGAILDVSSTSGDYEPVNVVGNFYQWGRKDPFPTFDNYKFSYPCVNEYKLLTIPTYTPVKALQLNPQSDSKDLNEQIFGYETNADGSVNVNKAENLIAKSAFAKSTDGLDVYLDYVTRNPYMFVRGTGPDGKLEYGNYNWYYKSDSDQTFKALWGDPDSGAGRKIEKSLYDPCPAGWRVMTKEVVDAFVTAFNAEGAASVDQSLHGMNFNNSYFPFSGDGREYNDFRVVNSAIGNVPAPAVFWNASASDGWSGWWYPGRLQLNAPAKATITSILKAEKKIDKCGAQGYPVRCVKE